MTDNSVKVKIWGELVGVVSISTSGTISFEYDSDFKKLNWELAPLKLPTHLDKTIFTFPNLHKNRNTELDTFKGLPGLLADSLPDKYGYQLINRWLVNQGRSPDSMNPIEMLSFIGNRGMGALEFEPSILKQDVFPTPIEIEKLVKGSYQLMHKNEEFIIPSTDFDEKQFEQLIEISTSVGGARPKALIACNEKTGEIKSGVTNTPLGFDQWLIKLDSVNDVQLGASIGYGRVEMAYYNMAVSCGIEIMPSRLLEENGRAHFMTKRFDRDGTTKYHIQTLCALTHFDFNNVTSYSYEQVFSIMNGLNISNQDIGQMYRRMVFNVMARNCDDHTKNFSFRLKKGGAWELAPAYDLCHAYRPGSEWVSHHALSINNKRIGITKEDLQAVGRLINIENAAEIIEGIVRVVAKWKKYAEEVKVDPKLVVSINESLKEQWNMK